MLCAPLDCQYAELPSSASDAVLCTVREREPCLNHSATAYTYIQYTPDNSNPR